MSPIATADLCDRWGDAVQVCTVPFRHFGGQTSAAGLISSLRCHEDAGLLRGRLEEPGERRILVVDGGGSLNAAILGNRMAAIAVANDWAGIVINGAVRDVAELAALPLVVLALGASPRRGGGSGDGERDVTLHFGAVEFEPGHFAAVDADGLVVMNEGPGDVPIRTAIDA